MTDSTLTSPVSTNSQLQTQGGVPPASLTESIQHLLIQVSGTVQGVGFRPFVYNLAVRLGVTGNVRNNNQGVTIRAEGNAATLREFLARLRGEAPPASRVTGMEVFQQPPARYSEFRILPSEHVPNAFTHVPPDLALCAECRQELADPTNRRYQYPFINCIHCGPRFSIVKELPYDRPVTTMSVFEMCEACRQEYETPSDRRFHTQPIACPACGPTLQLLNSTEHDWSQVALSTSALKGTADALRDGRIALIQGIGGFHLACDARNEDAVRELRRRKRREEKPLALMFPSLAVLKEWCVVEEAEEALLLSSRAPILLVRRRADCPVAFSVAPGNPYLGVMLPYSPLHLMILSDLGFPIVLTSANHSEEPIAYRGEDALLRLRGVADVALVHDRVIHMFADDSVVRVNRDAPVIWRRARGYVPEAITVPERFRRETIAFGPQLKNTFCIGKGELAILSQHLGDMDSETSLDAQAKALDHFIRLYAVAPELLVCDLHPDYATTRVAEAWSRERGLPLLRVQHHHAHLVSCLTDNRESTPAIGLCLDGTGYGPDGAIWGGEILAGDSREFRRAAHLEYVPMLGGEKAAVEPWRMALAWLFAAYGEDALRLNLPFLRELIREKGETALYALLNPRLGDSFPRTSSLGRLFDAVAALTFFGSRRQYEGQAAMQLEWQMSAAPEQDYTIELETQGETLVLSPQPLIRQLIEDLKARVASSVVSRRFHQGVVSAFVRACELVREQHDLSLVALSGGCLQNSFLHTEFIRALEAKRFRVLIHRQVPPNDGGVSLGQAVIANAQEA